MSLSKVQVDGFLADWGDGEYLAQVKMLRSRSKAAKLPFVDSIKKGQGAVPPTVEQKAQSVRDRLDRTAREVPEVVVKIYSSCKGMRQAGRHIDYISRKGELALEDQDSALLIGEDDLAAIKDEWRYGGVEVIENESKRRDTLNIVFSMPAYTDEVGLKRAVRDFAAIAFHGHRYVMAYHTPSTDPDPNPPEHPHIHLSVKFEREDGSRMNPRKAELQAWREGFAAKLRDNGIDANATSRLARLKRNRGDKLAVRAIRSKGQELVAVGQSEADPARIERAKALEAKRMEYNYAISHVLAQSELQADRILATRFTKSLVERYQSVQTLEVSQNTTRPPHARRDPREPDR